MYYVPLAEDTIMRGYIRGEEGGGGEESTPKLRHAFSLLGFETFRSIKVGVRETYAHIRILTTRSDI